MAFWSYMRVILVLSSRVTVKQIDAAADKAHVAATSMEYMRALVREYLGTSRYSTSRLGQRLTWCH